MKLTIKSDVTVEFDSKTKFDLDAAIDVLRNIVAKCHVATNELEEYVKQIEELKTPAGRKKRHGGVKVELDEFTENTLHVQMAVFPNMLEKATQRRGPAD